MIAVFFNRKFGLREMQNQSNMWVTAVIRIDLRPGVPVLAPGRFSPNGNQAQRKDQVRLPDAILANDYRVFVDGNVEELEVAEILHLDSNDSHKVA
jgi:hypothetical protein